jgi:hypothetical protein
VKLYHGDKVRVPIVDRGHSFYPVWWVEAWADEDRTEPVEPDQRGTIPISDRTHGGNIRAFVQFDKIDLVERGPIGREQSAEDFRNEQRAHIGG